MRKVLGAILAIGAALAISIGAFAGPYLEFEQGLIAPTPRPEEVAGVPSARVLLGTVLSFGETIVPDCPQTNSCGEVVTSTEIAVCLDLHMGLEDFWMIPWSPFFGADLFARWGFAALSLGTELGFDDEWDGWPLTTGDIEYWDTNVELGFYVVDWFRFYFGSDFVWNIDHLNPWPYFRFRLGDQGGCLDAGCLD